jgi:histidine triad (HIT) family protein
LSDCIFCKIVAGEIPAKEVLRDDDVLAIEDVNPVAPHHLLVLTTRHFANANELMDSGDAKLILKVFDTAAKLGREGSPGGFRLTVNSGVAGGQTVDHVHVHVIGGRQMTWPPG